MRIEMNITSNKAYWKEVGKDGCIEVSEWTNKEGFRIEVDASNNLGRRVIELSYSELDILKEIVDFIYKES